METLHNRGYFKMILEKNTYEGWQKAYTSLLQGEDRIIEVKINTADMDLGSVTNLRYFFPLAAHLLRVGKISSSTPLVLDIKLTGNVNKDDHRRLWAFFSQSHYISEVSIKVDGQKLKNIPWQASRIFPLCRVQRGDGTSARPNFQVLNECMFDADSRINIVENAEESYSELANELLKYVRDPDQYIGKPNRSFSKEEKELLQQEVDSYLDDQLGHMCILAQIIWLYILRELIKMKDLYSIPEVGVCPHIYESIMKKSRLDAVSYGESMYQLIENACIHSYGHAAWFGFRMHCAGKNGTMSNLIAETQNRNKLYKDYQLCFVKYDKNGKQQTRDDNIFNEDYRSYFEFFVLDDAADQLGMIGHYNREVFLENRDKILPYYKEQMTAEEREEFKKPEYPADIEPYQAEWEECKKQLSKKIQFKEEVQTLEQLFEIPVREYSLEDHVADITVHYGLRLLRKIISINGGYLLGRTPDRSGKIQRYYDGNLVPESEQPKSEDGSFMTEWNTIIPIAYKWSEFATDSEVVNGQNCFGSKIEQPRKLLHYLNYEDIFQGISNQPKAENIKLLRGNLHVCMSKLDKKELEDSVILLQSDSSVVYNLEIFSKALFAEIAEISNREDSPVALRIAVIFAHMDAIFEFIRLFSVFYPNGEQLDMKNVQIALCTKNSLYGDIYDVVVMLAGMHLSSTYGYARLFAYHHSDNALEYLPLLDYLTMKKDKAKHSEEDAENIELFPFELCLPAEFESRERQSLDWQHNWFIQKMKHILCTNIQDKNYGCMVDDIHIRLGSKLHMSRFYEAELLFHNMGNVVRFAYMIAQELLYGKRKLSEDQQILLLGYEKYSSMLIMQVEHWIKQSGQLGKVNTAIVYDGEGETEVEVRPYFDEEQDAGPEPGNVEVVTILPVGTTLSTVYKLHNVSRKNLGKYFGDQWTDRATSKNFCLIVVNKNLNASSDLSAVSARYWSKAEREAQLVTVQRECADEQEIQVKYFIEAEAEWMDPRDCPVCRQAGKDIRPIIDGKHSDMVPGAIFSLWGPHAGTFARLVGNKEENRKRIPALFGNVFYSHIYDGNNHFQFYINFKRLYEENKKAIDADLRRKRVKQNGFHVVISPLQLTNSTFVKAVIDNAFDGNVRFLHMDLTDAYREEVRAKFSHLTEEFRRMRLTNPKAKFSFHFVDTSVVTGNRLNRARLLIRMLLNQSYVDYDDVQLFDRVFLLVNRCSYDTANYFVREPEYNMYAYIHLAIPSYNTENDFCPACKLTAKYRLLEKRSSTERLSREFLRLQEKHKKRTFDEYQFWLEGNNRSIGLSGGEYIQEQDGALLTSPAYFGWLKQWLYVNVPTSQSKLLSFVPKEAQLRESHQGAAALKNEYRAGEIIKKRIEEYANTSGDWESKKIRWEWGADEDQLKERDVYLEKLAKTNLNDVAKYISDKTQKEEFLSFAKSIIKSHLVGVRDYMRLKAMQQSYEELESKEFERDSMNSSKYREVILDLISSALASKDTENMKSQLVGLTEAEQKRFLLTYNVEWLISYVKVLSRAQIVNYYEYRQAITGIMSDMLRVLSRKDLYEIYIKKLAGEKKHSNTVSKKWESIVRLLGNIREYDGGSGEQQLCAQLCYQVNMTLIHRMADLQISSRVDIASVLSIMKLYSELLDRYFLSKPANSVPYIDLPSSSKVIIRYLKAAKAATMTSHDDVPCLVLTATPSELEQELNNVHKPKTTSMEQNLLCAAQYIYLENTRMLYSGMLDMKKMISADVLAEVETCRPADSFAEYMGQLSKEVERCLGSCYQNLGKEAKEEALLYQNPLANFCRFWHESTGEAPIGDGDKIIPIAYMLRYFMRLDDLSGETAKKRNSDELPYLYEELCRILCGITGFQMCYLTYCHAGNYPEIFAQSGYHVELMMNGKLLTPMRVDEIVRLARDKENELVSGIAKITTKKDCDYLVLFIPLIEDRQSSDGFYIVFQSDKKKDIFLADKSKLGWTALRKARDVLFLRQRLQEVLSRDYTVLINYRFDCSYVRSISKDNEGHPSAMHISDLHIQQDMSEQSSNICKHIVNALQKCETTGKLDKIDLLIISGDIVDSREANAPRMEQNYRYAEQLLNHIVSTLWADESGYLPHDWRRRIIVTTGNHDFASMNQYQAAQKGRVLTSAIPADGESGTMSKFAYFIEFLIHYLDAPVDQLLYNDLNEVRFYQKLNLKVLVLNCSGSATPRRTNKMGINSEKVRELLERDTWKSTGETIYDEKGVVFKREPFRLVIGHYSPQYELSYFLDKYDVLPGWVWEPEGSGIGTRPINNLVKVFQEAAQIELTYRFSKTKKETNRKVIRQKFMEEFKHLNIAMKVLENSGVGSPSPTVDDFCNRLNAVVDDMLRKDSHSSQDNRDKVAKKVVRKMKENDLYKQLEKYNNWLEVVTNKDETDSDEWSEEISKLLYEVDESIRMGEQDKELFYNFIDKEIGDKDLYLAGHIHAYAEDINNHILVADKLFDKSRVEIHGYIIQDLIKRCDVNDRTYHSKRLCDK